MGLGTVDVDDEADDGGGGGIGGGIVRRTAIKETVGHALGDLEMHDSENGI